MLAVQFLEPGPKIQGFSPDKAKICLQNALNLLPIDTVIIGWDLPPRLVDVCVQETRRVGAELYAWHPLLTGNGGLVPQKKMQVVGLQGEPIAGYRDLPEFTFICPNNPDVFRAVLERLNGVLANSPYQGVFLDRIRFPSPCTDPGRLLGCFCPDCQKLAASEGLDLVAAQYRLRSLLDTPNLIKPTLQRMLAPYARRDSYTDPTMLRRFFDFRARCITRMVQAASKVARHYGKKIGLDCFSPVLTPLVGQDLAGLDGACDWIKVMLYGHTLAPAGLPYELLGLARWVSGLAKISENQALRWLGEAASLPMPESSGEMREHGLFPETLGVEGMRAREAGVRKTLAGMELVDLAGVTRISPEQIQADLYALRDAKVNGLVLSWDLLWMPPEWLKIVGKVFCQLPPVE